MNLIEVRLLLAAIAVTVDRADDNLAVEWTFTLAVLVRSVACAA